MKGLFTKIIEGKIPSYKIFEDDLTYAFLDIRPITDGHSLIIPKKEVDYFVDVPEPYYSKVFENAKKLATVLKEVTNCTRVATVIAGYEVPHFHYHLIPSWGLSDIDFSKAKERDESYYKDMQKKVLKHL